MKKSLIALAVLAASGAAMAQSSVTLFGVLDVGVTHGSGDVANKTQLSHSGHTASRLGFRGVEDLGGGLKAGFHLEAGINPDDGSATFAAANTNNQASGAITSGGLTFGRRATLSLMGNFGEVRLGRDYTPQFWNVTTFDPFGYNGVGNVAYASSTNGYALGGPTAVRASNSIAYHLPANLGGFYGTAMYHMGENVKNGAATEKDGNGLGFRAGYAQGPIDAALAYSETKYATGDIKSFNLGGSYNLGVAKLMAQYNQDKNDLSKVKGTGYLIGGLVPMGAGEVRLSYSTFKIDTAAADPKVNKFALGYVHNLSKRTAVYATYAHLSNKNGASFALGGATGAANQNSNGYDFGVKHSF